MSTAVDKQCYNVLVRKLASLLCGFLGPARFELARAYGARSLAKRLCMPFHHDPKKPRSGEAKLSQPCRFYFSPAIFQTRDFTISTILFCFIPTKAKCIARRGYLPLMGTPLLCAKATNSSVLCGLPSLKAERINLPNSLRAFNGGLSPRSKRSGCLDRQYNSSCSSRLSNAIALSSKFAIRSLRCSCCDLILLIRSRKSLRMSLIFNHLPIGDSPSRISPYWGFVKPICPPFVDNGIIHHPISHVNATNSRSNHAKS